jgi:Fur family transcriptional regulator, ferric uptake regulator
MTMERNTKQRDAIRQALRDAARPLSPQELLDAASESVPNLGIATVYRTIKSLLEDGDIVPVELPGGGTRYETAHLHHHHHFHCRQCDRVYEVEGCPGDLRKLAPRGFKTERHEIVLSGLCAQCVKGKKQAH